MPRIAALRRLPVHLTALLLLVMPFSAAADEKTQTADWKQLYEHWYVLEIAGAEAGWMRETASDDGKQYRLESEVHFKISRGAFPVEAAMSTTSLETHGGKLSELRYRQDMAQMSLDSQWTFHDDHVMLVSRQGGRVLEKKLDPPQDGWLSPMAVSRFWRERREAGAEEITFRTLDPEQGLEPVTVRQVLQGEEEYEFGGRKIPVTVWKTTSSALPGIESISRISADGYQVYEEVAVGLGVIVTRIATREQALAAGGAPPPELMVSTFVRPDRPIPNPDKVHVMKLRLKTRDGRLPDIPAAGAQRVELDENGKSAILTIDIDDPLPASQEEGADPKLREPSSMADSSDPMVKKLARRAVRGTGEDPIARAEAIRAFVYDHISSKSLDTAFATASETARMKTGDCSEHGVLLCAMLRAEGIPARVASGLLYVDEFAGEEGVFGWHMWTQALIDGKWVDLDATLPVRYHAGHVLTGTSSLADGAAGGDLSALMLLVGNLDIEIIDLGSGDTD
ncbi:MAG: transglutaminase domain-containing protein [Phycisphaerales bacterium]|nr:MAG: transglutaminase domain-containing protein [Phycisphaerales bacterium]